MFVCSIARATAALAVESQCTLHDVLIESGEEPRSSQRLEATRQVPTLGVTFFSRAVSVLDTVKVEGSTTFLEF